MNFYLQKYGFQGPFIATSPHADLALIVVIPCFNEPDLNRSLSALYDCDQPKKAVEVIVVINSGEHHSDVIKQQNEETFKLGKIWQETQQNDRFKVHFILQPNLPQKHAGVGLARKIGMDEAVYRFDQLQRDGIIVCFDADSSCDPSYLLEIENHFRKYPKTPGCSIHFEHPLKGDEYDTAVYQGIIFYELHLRYYNQALRYCGLPYAFHTVGSSMAVRSSIYQKQGGMNRRKAGEDFYFIHKIIELGDFTELKSTRVIPSPRVSDRVPFGTGKAIGDWIQTEEANYFTYNFESFKLIRTFIELIPALQNQDLAELDWKVDDAKITLFSAYLTTQNFDTALAEIRKNAKTPEAFLKRFYKWFDAFQVLKLVHFLRDNGFENKPVQEETCLLLTQLGISYLIENQYDQLVLLREIEKNK